MKVYIRKSPTANFEHIDIKDTPLGKGGQGAVHNIITPAYSAEYCIKIYLREPEKSFSKISYMVEHQPKNIKDNPNFRICWPTALVFDQSRKFIGYMMPLAFPKGHDLTILSVYQRRPLAQIKRYQKYTEWHGKYELDTPVGIQNRIKMLCNVAIALHCIHATGKYVIVDLKPENIDATGTGKVSIMDTDSIQISENGKILFPATAFTPDYFAPEGKDIKKRDLPFPAQCDYFAAAVCFYQILTGTHPYSGTVLKPPYDKLTTLEECIAAGLFPYGTMKKYISLPKGFNLHQNFNNLPKPVQELFIRAFGTNPNNRPSMEEWGRAFFALIKNNIKVGASTVKRDTSGDIPLKITDVKIADQANDGSTIRAAGKPLYTDISYLCPVITYQVKNAIGSATLRYRIISPSGSIVSNDNTTGTVNLKATGTFTSTLSGWGNSKKNTYNTPGDWTIEFYYAGKCIHRTKFTVNKLGTSSPRVTTTSTSSTTPARVPITINHISFSNQTYDGKLIGKRNGKLYTNTTYLCPTINYTTNQSSGDIEVGIKIIGPKGSIITRSNNTDKYTVPVKWSSSGCYDRNVSGWGNKNNNCYNVAGTYTFEVYYQGQRIYSTTFQIHEKSLFGSFGSGSSSRTSSAASVGGFWSRWNDKVKYIGEWIDDNRDRIADSDVWSVICGILGALILLLAAIETKSLLWGGIVFFIGIGIGYYLVPLAAIPISFVVNIFLRLVKYVFYNIYTLIIAILFILSATCDPIIDKWLKDESTTKVEQTEKTTIYRCTSSKALNVRGAPNSNASIIGTLQPKQEVEVYSTRNGFAKIRFKGGTGYASLDYLEKVK